MWYENKKLKIKVSAQSEEEAKEYIKEIAKEGFKKEDVVEINPESMIYTKNNFMNELWSSMEYIITDWCICWYCTKIKNKNKLLESKKEELADYLLMLNKAKFKKGVKSETKRNILNHYMDWRDYDKRPEKVRLQFAYHFGKLGLLQNTKKNYNKLDAIAEQFVKEVPKLIDIICSNSWIHICSYIDNKFNLSKEN